MLPLTTQAASPDLQPVRLMLQWTPQAQFAGYFIALEKGFYRQHGIDMTIISGGQERLVSDLLANDQADFGMMFLATAIERHDAGMPLVNVGQIIHHSTLMLVAKADSGIETIADLHGKKVTLWPNEFQIQPRMWFDQAGIEVTVIPQTSSLDLFLRGAVAAASAMWYNEYHTLLSTGLRRDELKTFFFRDTDYDFPEDGIYCLRSTFEKNPQLAKAVFTASMAGWRYAFAHEDEALKIVADYMTAANLPVNRAHQRWMLQRMRDIIAPEVETDELNPLSYETFNAVMTQLLERRVIQNQVDYNRFYPEISQ